MRKSLRSCERVSQGCSAPYWPQRSRARRGAVFISLHRMETLQSGTFARWVSAYKRCGRLGPAAAVGKGSATSIVTAAGIGFAIRSFRVGRGSNPASQYRQPFRKSPSEPFGNEERHVRPLHKQRSGARLASARSAQGNRFSFGNTCWFGIDSAPFPCERAIAFGLRIRCQPRFRASRTACSASCRQ